MGVGEVVCQGGGAWHVRTLPHLTAILHPHLVHRQGGWAPEAVLTQGTKQARTITAVSVLYETETAFHFNLFPFFGRHDFNGRHSPRQVDPGDTGIYANVPATFPRRT